MWQPGVLFQYNLDSSYQLSLVSTFNISVGTLKNAKYSKNDTIIFAIREIIKATIT
jgi:hypothetical protein